MQNSVLETIHHTIIICVLDPGYVLKVNFNFSVGAVKPRSREAEKPRSREAEKQINSIKFKSVKHFNFSLCRGGLLILKVSKN